MVCKQRGGYHPLLNTQQRAGVLPTQRTGSTAADPSASAAWTVLRLDMETMPQKCAVGQSQSCLNTEVIWACALTSTVSTCEFIHPMASKSPLCRQCQPVLFPALHFPSCLDPFLQKLATPCMAKTLFSRNTQSQQMPSRNFDNKSVPTLLRQLRLERINDITDSFK